MLIIGLGTQKRVGKDSLAAHIIRERGDKFNIVRRAYADEVKRECSADFIKMFPMARYANPQALLGYWTAWCRAKAIPLSSPVEVTNEDIWLCPWGKCRQALQWWGSEFRRSADPNYWVNRMDENLLSDIVNSEVDVVFITDMRFPNEWRQIRQAPAWSWLAARGKCWKLVREYPEGENPLPDNHVSERALDGYDFDQVITGSTIQQTLEAGLEAFDNLTSSLREKVNATARNRF